MYGDDDWIEAHIETFAAFAKEHDNPPEYQNPEIGHIDTSDTDEIRQALKDRGYEGDVLDDFLTELESEEKDEMIAENESKPIELETVDTEMTADTTASLEETNVDTEEPEESKWTHVLAWGVTIFFLIAFALGCIWQKRRKQ